MMRAFFPERRRSTFHAKPVQCSYSHESTGEKCRFMRPDKPGIGAINPNHTSLCPQALFGLAPIPYAFQSAEKFDREKMIKVSNRSRGLLTERKFSRAAMLNY